MRRAVDTSDCELAEQAMREMRPLEYGLFDYLAETAGLDWHTWTASRLAPRTIERAA